MVEQFLVQKIAKQLPFEPTAQQSALIGELAAFMFSRERHEVFLLRGFAGTGKTSVVSALVRTLAALGQRFVLLAPTGRAAKVLSSYSGHQAYTIHKHIYRQKSDGTTFSLGFNKLENALFIVDEASMISNSAQTGQNAFGSGRLLDDLLEFVYEKDSCRLLLVGDTAQLPPVMCDASPALDKGEIESLGFGVRDFLMTDVVRQQKQSGILLNATMLRRQIEDERFFEKPELSLAGFPDIENVSSEFLEEKLQDSYREVGAAESIIVTRSNKHANFYANSIRNRILYKEDELTTGDLLIVTKNNYHWSEQNKSGMEFIANGDIAEVTRIGKHYEMYGFRFADLAVRFADYDTEMDVRLLTDTLHFDTPAETAEANRRLFAAVQEDYMHIPNRQKRFREMRKDPYLNALQAKFAYAITCHKAQGGQWKHVFIDHGNISEEMMDIQYFRWLYTALTRATEKAFLINFSRPDAF